MLVQSVHVLHNVSNHPSQPDVGRLMTGVGGVEGREQYCRADMEAIGVG